MNYITLDFQGSVHTSDPILSSLRINLSISELQEKRRQDLHDVVFGWGQINVLDNGMSYL